MRYPLKCYIIKKEEELIMSRQKNQHTRQFKLDAINYRKEHPDLTQVECAKNLGIGVSTLARWESQFRENDGDIPVIGSGNYASEEEKEIARLKRELRDAQDALDVLKKAIGILNEQFNPERPNAVRCTDITYIWTQDGFVYLNCVMDLYARKIIAWTLADTMEVSTVIETINKAKACRNTDLPLIIHSDRGSRYISNAWREATEKMQQSYSHSGYPYDNACIESFHSLIKREWLNRFYIINYKHAYRLVFEYIETFYNTVRIHSHCDYMSPNDFEKLFERLSSLPAA